MKSKLLDELSIYELKSEGINFDRTMKGLVGGLVSDIRAAKETGSGLGLTSVLNRKDEEILMLSRMDQKNKSIDRDLLKARGMYSLRSRQSDGWG